MRIYVSASYPRIEEARKVASALNALGHEVTSKWLESKASIYRADSWLAERQAAAKMDLEDVSHAEAMVVLTGDTLTKGGRHGEVGMAVAMGMPVMLIGPREMVFHYHPCIVVADQMIDIVKTPVEDLAVLLRPGMEIVQRW